MRRRGFLSALLLPLLPTPLPQPWLMSGKVFIFNDVKFYGEFGMWANMPTTRVIIKKGRAVGKSTDLANFFMQKVQKT